jgi:hypothetical protein
MYFNRRIGLRGFLTFVLSVAIALLLFSYMPVLAANIDNGAKIFSVLMYGQGNKINLPTTELSLWIAYYSEKLGSTT